MTRDEAIKGVIEPDAGYDHQHAFVDSLVALGILKLDEPKSAESRFREAFSHLSKPAQCSADNVWEIIHNSGLQIVEK